MTTFTHREIDLQVAESRAKALDPAAEESTLGSQLSELTMHGGLYSLGDRVMMEKRLSVMKSLEVAKSGASSGVLSAALLAKAAAIPTFYFFHIKYRPYKLHAGLVSYLTYPNIHLKSPLPLPANDYRPRGKTFSQVNTPSPEIPAAFTFVGQFIDHDLTLNAVNLFDDQGKTVPDDASPLIDLDSVYGPRIDDLSPTHGNREIPMDNGYFRLRAIAGGGYDVCREDAHKPNQHFRALIGDKRNDENQIILQIHILLMRLHNAFRSQGLSMQQAQEQTILHWQSVVATEYLPLVADPAAIASVLQKLKTAPDTLLQRPGLTPAGPTVLGMPHEFAIGFRFGHSQLRSRYHLNPQHEFRLFDNLSDNKNDLLGGKCLTHDRIIDWPYFLQVTNGKAAFPSNLIDTQVNQVVFDLPEGTIPDQVNLVTNLPFRNLQRSDSVELCAGEDLAAEYKTQYPAVTALTDSQVEPDATYRRLFMFESNEFRTPLWYYLLREAEVNRTANPSAKGHLGALGSHLVSEVILSGIWYATPSYLQNTAWTSRIPTTTGDNRKVKLIDIANFVAATNVSPPACAAGNVC
ncbi:hypothetical protein [uncultured Bradyrhizobium sp.]|uniref:hypothetical protein n=1 Tax=uncultured Bradyrhizobium sp. TaxID=199684 RepID=UPI0035C98E19